MDEEGCGNVSFRDVTEALAGERKASEPTNIKELAEGYSLRSAADALEKEVSCKCKECRCR